MKNPRRRSKDTARMTPLISAACLVVKLGGDSGAPWVALDTRAPVALHQRGNAAPRRFAIGIAVNEALAALRLDLVLPRRR